MRTFALMKDYRYVWMLLSILLCASSCAAENEENGRSQIPQNEQHVYSTTYHILVLGDSFSRDAFSYVPGVLEDLLPDVSIDMEILYLGGKGLKYHLDYLSNDLSQFTLDEYVSADHRWYSSYGISGKDVVRSKQWDLVIMQEGSITIRSYDNTLPHIVEISNYIRQWQPSAIFALMLSSAKPEGSPAIGDYTSDEVWQLNMTTAKTLLDNEKVDYVIPCGTAIQNARQTYIDDRGDFGHLSYDGDHLQEGLPCLIEAYVAAEFFLRLKEVNASVATSNLRITQKWVNQEAIPGKHGAVIEGSEEEYIICKNSAFLALEHPYEIIKPNY